LTLYCNADEKGAPLFKDGAPQFKSEKDKEEYLKEREKLLMAEAEDIEPIKLRVKDMKLTEGRLSAADLLSLAGIIELEEG